MENFVVYDNVYSRILKKDEISLIKYSPVSLEAWGHLSSKNIDFINAPFEIYGITAKEKCEHTMAKSKVLLPFLKGYDTFEYSNALDNLNTYELLLLMKQLMFDVKIMHDKNVCHGDIHSGNIMVKDNNIKFIDMDAMIVDDIISLENVYYEDKIPFSEKVNLSIRDDKNGILSLFLYYLDKGTFEGQMNDFIDVYNLGFSDEIKKEISIYQLNLKSPDKGYYYEDIFDELLRVGYEAPKLVNRI